MPAFGGNGVAQFAESLYRDLAAPVGLAAAVLRRMVVHKDSQTVTARGQELREKDITGPEGVKGPESVSEWSSGDRGGGGDGGR